ncbi:MAG: hypothetical protein V1919_01535 [Candidatus Omnitrophota bacterium]
MEKTKSKKPILKVILRLLIVILILILVAVIIQFCKPAISNVFNKLNFFIKKQAEAKDRAGAVVKSKKADTSGAGLECKINGILYSQNNPFVMIDKKMYYLNDSVCGGKITGISPDKIKIKFQEREGIYKVGNVIKQEAGIVSSKSADTREKLNKEGPAKAFLIFHTALYNKDTMRVKKYLSKSMLADLAKREFGEGAKLLEALNVFFPKELKIIDEKTEGDKAFVRATADVTYDQPVGWKNENGKAKPMYVEHQKHTITMTKEDGDWKILTFEYKW